MERVERISQWIDAHRDQALDVIRIYLGLALFAKGVAFIGHMMELSEEVRIAVGFAPAVLAHFVVAAHLAGGLLMAVGLVTRLAAAVQLPVVAGAIVFVHAKQGLFTDAMTLELSLLVLFLLGVYTVVGARHFSVDAYLARWSRANDIDQGHRATRDEPDVHAPLRPDPRKDRPDAHP
jgi:uncharacterized membrane protein YphA (DoxX/SURF4 family)